MPVIGAFLIGVPAWRGLSKTVGGFALNRWAYADGAPDSFTESDTKTTPVNTLAKR